MVGATSFERLVVFDRAVNSETYTKKYTSELKYFICFKVQSKDKMKVLTSGLRFN